MIRITDIHIYHFHNEPSLEIIEKHNLDKFSVFDDDKKVKGIRLLQEETIKQLNYYFENDYTGVLLYLESIRFLPYLLHNQKLNNYFDTYYKGLLNYFHSKDLLKYKKMYKPYKEFYVKKPLIQINYKYSNYELPITYKSYKCLTNDFGRYRAEKILKNRKFVYDYDEILRIINE